MSPSTLGSVSWAIHRDRLLRAADEGHVHRTKIISRPWLKRSLTALAFLSTHLGPTLRAHAQENEASEEQGDSDESRPEETEERVSNEPGAEEKTADDSNVEGQQARSDRGEDASGERPENAHGDGGEAAQEELPKGSAEQLEQPDPAEAPQEKQGPVGEPADDDSDTRSDASDEEPAPIQDEELMVDESFFEGEEELEFGAVAEVEAPPREPTKRTLEATQLTRIPGTRGDALRAIEIMPGVARTPFGANDGPPLLRGSSSEDSLVLLDGASVPLLYHFGGLTSFFNSQLLESVDLYPGNFSARYGRASGGVVAAQVRDPREDKFHAMLELSAIDSFALVESPITKKTSVALAARRSNIDLFFDAFLPEDSFNVLAAPVYYDYQAIISHRFDERHQLRVLGYGSFDRLEFFLSDAAAEDPALRGSIDNRTQFHRAQVELNSKFSELVTQKLMVSVGPSLSKQVLGDLDAQFDFVDVNARAEWSIFAHETLRIDTGIDFSMFAGKGRYVGPAPVADEGQPLGDSLASERYIAIEPETVYPIRPAVYLEASYRPVENWLLVPGVRADYIADAGDWTVDPRFSSRLTVVEGTTLKTGVGLYSQPPEYFELMDELGNPKLRPFRTLQSSLGVEQRIFEGVTADVEGFYKHWYDRVTGTEGGAPPRFENDGSGRAYGLEVLLDVRPTKRTQAFASYTLMRSERVDDPNDDYRLFDYDQTHNLSLTANYDFGKGWMLGARFRYVTGTPTTPVLGAVYDSNNDTYRAIYGPVNTDRLAAFHQLDIRGEKRWDIGPVGLTVYLEVMNVYNQQNVEGTSYSFDYTQTEEAVGLPIFPNLGIRGEL